MMKKIKVLEAELEHQETELEREKQIHEQDIRYKDEVINNYKESLSVFKKEPGRALQAELLELRKRTTADAFLIDEYYKTIESEKAFISIQKQQIDSLSLLIGVIVNNLKNGCQELTEEGYLKIDIKSVEEVHGSFDVAITESDNTDFVFIKCELKEAEAQQSENE